MPKLKIVVSLNPNDISGQSPDREFDDEEQSFSVDSPDSIKQSQRQALTHFEEKFRYRYAGSKQITLWNPSVWQNKIVPNVKFKLNLEGKEKELTNEELSNLKLSRIYSIRGRQYRNYYTRRNNRVIFLRKFGVK